MTPRLVIEPEPSPPGSPLAADDAITSIIVTALEQCLAPPKATRPRRTAPGWRTGPSYPWRFSGRWWSTPATLRRERPAR